MISHTPLLDNLIDQLPAPQVEIADTVTTAILAFYQKPAAAVAATVLIAAVCVTLLHRLKKPWLYHYALAVTVLAAIALAWPRA